MMNANALLEELHVTAEILKEEIAQAAIDNVREMESGHAEISRQVSELLAKKLQAEHVTAIFHEIMLAVDQTCDQWDEAYLAMYMRSARLASVERRLKLLSALVPAASGATN